MIILGMGDDEPTRPLAPRKDWFERNFYWLGVAAMLLPWAVIAAGAIVALVSL